MSIDYEKIPHYKYRLLSDKYIAISKSLREIQVKRPFIYLDIGMLHLIKGYAWDGCTYFPDFKKLMRASLVHDALCQLVNTLWLPKRMQRDIDLEFRRIAIEDGFNPWMADIAYRAIRVYQTVKGKTGCAK